MRIQRNLRLIDGFTLGLNMLFILPTLVPYYRDHIGLGFREFLIGEAVFAATIVLLEVPTGWISDVWQRKYTLAIGAVFQLAGFICLFFAHSFFMAMLVQVLLGIGISLCSGTNTAMLYDSLLSAGREGEYRKREGRRGAMGFYTVAVSCVVGGFLYEVHHQLPLLLTIAGCIPALICTLLMDEPERHKRRPERHPLADIIETVKYALHGHAEVGFLILSASALFSATKLIMWSQQPYYMEMKIPEVYFGILMAVGLFLSGAASHMSHLLDGRTSPHRALAGFLLLAIVVCLGASIGPGWHGVVLLMVGGTCIYGAAMPRVSEAINQHVDSARRATILSTQSLLTSLFSIPLMAAVGEISKQWDIQAVLISLAVWLCFAGICLVALRVVKERRTQKGFL